MKRTSPRQVRQGLEPTELGPRSFRLPVRESTYRLCLECLAVPTSSVVVAAVVSRTLARWSRPWMHPCHVAPLPPPGLSAFCPRPELVPTVPSSCPRPARASEAPNTARHAPRPALPDKVSLSQILACCYRCYRCYRRLRTQPSIPARAGGNSDPEVIRRRLWPVRR